MLELYFLTILLSYLIQVYILLKCIKYDNEYELPTSLIIKLQTMFLINSLIPVLNIVLFFMLLFNIKSQIKSLKKRLNIY